MKTLDSALYNHLIAREGIDAHVLVWIEAKNKTLEVGTNILVLPQRNPLVLAKELATLDFFSGGRLELGVRDHAWCRSNRGLRGDLHEAVAGSTDPGDREVKRAGGGEAEPLRLGAVHEPVETVG